MPNAFVWQRSNPDVLPDVLSQERKKGDREKPLVVPKGAGQGPRQFKAGANPAEGVRVKTPLWSHTGERPGQRPCNLALVGNSWPGDRRDRVVDHTRRSGDEQT
jgi:hypothetical protein